MLAVCECVFCAIFVSSSSKYIQYYFVLLEKNYHKIRDSQPSSHPFSAARFFVYYSVRLAYKRQADNYCINFYVSLQPGSHPFSAARFFVYYSVRLAYKRQADNYCINFYVSLQPGSHPFSAVRFFVYYSVRLAYKRQADIFHYTFALKSLFRAFHFGVIVIRQVLLRPFALPIRSG